MKRNSIYANKIVFCEEKISWGERHERGTLKIENEIEKLKIAGSNPEN